MNDEKKALMLVFMVGPVRLIFCAFLAASSAAYAAETLPSLGIDASQVTVSGISSGAFFAIQFATAHSAKVKGVGSFAGGVYNCAEGDFVRASSVCMKDPQGLDLQRSLEDLKKNAQSGVIDDLENISRQKIYLYHGQKDSVIHPAAGEKMLELYQALGAKITERFDTQGGHGFPSEQASAACETNQKPWLNNCLMDGAGEVLQTLYGSLTAPVPMKRQNLFSFAQTEFDIPEAGMGDEGYIYIPQVCRQQACRLHVAFHGCQQNPATVSDQFIAKAGYNNWAEANRLVILYPSVSVSKKNPQGCWDWYGYSGKEYALKSGRQIMVVHKMLMRLKRPANLHPQIFPN